MKTPVERDDFVAPCVITRQLDGGLDRFGARVAEEHFLRLFSGRHGREALRQFHHVRQIEISAGNVNQLSGLLLNRRDDTRMAVSGRDHGNTRGEIQKGVAVDVLNNRAAPGFRDHRVAARVRRRDDLRVPRDDLFRVGTGERGDEIWQLHFASDSNR